KGDPEKYDRFFHEHGHCLKEGVTVDWSHKEAIAKLLRFESSHTEPGKTTSLADYISRMPAEQTDIYWLLAPSRDSAEASPYFEVFREKKFEVLFLTHAHDEFVMDHLASFDGKKLVSAEKADLKLDKESTGLNEDAARLLANFFKETLGDRVGEVRASKRLVGSPAVALESDTHITTSMRRVMKMMRRAGDAFPESKPDLEINPDHPMSVRLEETRGTDGDLARQVAEQIYDNALVAAGLLEDPRAMLSRMNSLLEKLLAKDSTKAG